MKRRVCGYSFRSALSLEKIFETLNADGLLIWRMRDNDSFGDYISAGAVPKPHFGVVAIIPRNEGYTLNIRVVVDSEKEEELHAEFETVRTKILNAVLPAIGATEIVLSEFLER